jgi:hypothetical protein
MNYIDTPLSLQVSGSRIDLDRNIEEKVTRLDNLVRLIVFTPRGNFSADPDFGFEFWNHEFSNIRQREFNNDHTGMSSEALVSEVTKKECEDSIRNSLAAYEPMLKDVFVRMELKIVEPEKQIQTKVRHKFLVKVIVEGNMEDGLGTSTRYEKEVSFLMEPTAKKERISI